MRPNSFVMFYFLSIFEIILKKISICFKQLQQQFNQEACIISIVSEISSIVKPMLLLSDILLQNTKRFKRFNSNKKFFMLSDPFYRIIQTFYGRSQILDTSVVCVVRMKTPPHLKVSDKHNIKYMVNNKPLNIVTFSLRDFRRRRKYKGRTTVTT